MARPTIPMLLLLTLVNAGCDAGSAGVTGDTSATVAAHPLADEGYQKRRSRLFTTPARSIVRDTAHRGPVVTLVMEYRMENEDVLTVGSLADGTVDVYVASGGGVVGGGQRPPVRAEAMRLLRAAGTYLDLFKPATDREAPPPGSVHFYARTRDDRLLSLRVDRAELDQKRHPASELYKRIQTMMAMMNIVNAG